MKPAFLAAVAALATLSGLAQASEPYCVVEETCITTGDNCTPAEGRLDVRRVSQYRAEMVLNDRPAVEGIILDHKAITTVLGDLDGVHYQLRIQPDGTFNYLVETPNSEAWKGKDQVLFRGHCIEGS